jgi:hypothetical protein
MDVKAICKVWSEQDVHKFKALLESGASALRVAAVLGRSRRVVKQKAGELGIPFPTELELRAKRRRLQNSIGKVSTIRNVSL